MATLQEKLKSGRFVVTAEVAPPTSFDAADLLAKAAPLRGLADAVNVTDGAGARAHLGAVTAAGILLSNGIEPILQMADLSAMTTIAEVYESDIERLSKWVQAGPVKAEIKNPALPRPLSGVVRSEQDISRMIAKNQVFAMGPREDADRRVIEVVVHLNADAIVDASRFVWLQVTVTLEPGK